MGASTGGASNMGAPSGAGPSTMAHGASQGATQGQFMTQMRGQQMMASKLIGTTVVSTNNESIGDLNDVILDRSGQVMAVVVGVGGFLGIGEKDVAVPFSSLEFASREQMNAANNAAGNVTSTGSTSGGGATNRSTATTGNTGGNGASTSPDSVGSAPDRIMLRMTKAELQSAPSFRTSNSGSTNGTAGGTSGTNSAPKQ